MTIGAVILVLDEIDLLRRNLAYHSSIGVDYFVICDRGSSDDAQEELEKLARNDNIHLFKQHLYQKREITAEVMRRARLAALNEMQRVFAPDWLFPADTDEFWVPKCGSLARSVGAFAFEHLNVSRFNAALTSHGVPSLLQRMQQVNALLDQDIVVQREKLSQMKMETNPKVPWIFHAVGSKFMTSRADFVEVSPGFHDVRYSCDVQRSCPLEILILHVPFTTFERFSRKASNARRHLKHIGPTFKSSQAWHWKRWVAIDHEAELEKEFGKQFFSVGDLKRLRSRGFVKSIKDYFEAQVEENPRPREGLRE